jgi:hypothetical protein
MKKQTIPEQIKYLVELEERIRLSKDMLGALQTEHAARKNVLLDAMIEGGSRRTDTISGHYAIRVASSTKQVDAREAEAYVRANDDLPQESFYTFSTTAYKKYADQTLKENGEIVPGITPVSSEYLSIREAK